MQRGIDVLLVRTQLTRTRIMHNGFTILQEIDTPGHTAIISESHPEHVACPQAAPWADFANGRLHRHIMNLPLDEVRIPSRTPCRAAPSCLPRHS